MYLSESELKIVHEIDRICNEEYSQVFGHRVPGHLDRLIPDSKEYLERLKKVIATKDESLWTKGLPPIPPGARI